MANTDILLIDPTTDFIGTQRVEAVKREQHITQEFLDKCANERFEAARNPIGDFHKFASIPTIVWEKWMREGFDPQKQSARAVLKKLREESLDDFITTNRNL